MDSSPPQRSASRCYDAGMSAPASAPSMKEDPIDELLDRRYIDDIRTMERAAGRNDVLSRFVGTLERNLAGFDASFGDCIARGDPAGAARAAHTLKGTCLQLGAQALGKLFA